MAKLTKATIIRRALRILDERGWTRATMVDSRGQCCMLGALRLAAQEGLKRPKEYDPDDPFFPLPPNREALYEEAAGVVAKVVVQKARYEHWVNSHYLITRYNDVPLRRRRDIEATLQQALEEAK